MNYRHAFHAGNFADVLKHVVLALLVEDLKRKPAAFFYLDTHAGRGCYDLSESQAQRSGEYKSGIGRLLELPAAGIPEELDTYLGLVKQSAGPGRSPITAYPGSPMIVAMLRRDQDRMALYESQPAEAQALRDRLRGQRRLSIVEADGYAGLKAQLPPKEKRGLVLIDPPYESEREFDALLEGLRLAHARWPTGIYCIWYPRTGRSAPGRFLNAVQASGIRRVLNVTLDVLPEGSPLGMGGAGLVIVNPPWQLDLLLEKLLPQLHALLSLRGAGGWDLRWLVPE
jgi:23S rRNA (adenine2030-N6)-methyltransferase